MSNRPKWPFGNNRRPASPQRVRIHRIRNAARGLANSLDNLGFLRSGHKEDAFLVILERLALSEDYADLFQTMRIQRRRQK